MCVYRHMLKNRVGRKAFLIFAQELKYTMDYSSTELIVLFFVVKAMEH